MLGFVVVCEIAVGNNTTIDVREAFLQGTSELTRWGECEVRSGVTEKNDPAGQDQRGRWDEPVVGVAPGVFHRAGLIARLPRPVTIVQAARAVARSVPLLLGRVIA